MKFSILLVALITLLACGACAGKDACFDCHRVMEGMSLKFTNDIHFASAISCANCHGGDPNETNQNISMSASRGFKVRVTRQGVPEFCGKCHSDTNFMSKYDPNRAWTSLHNTRPAFMASCWRPDASGWPNVWIVTASTIPARSAIPLSTASPQRISKTCAKCHAATAEAFAGSPHGRRFKTARRPGCTVCHSGSCHRAGHRCHAHRFNFVCTRCHRPGTPPLKLAEDMAQVLAESGSRRSRLERRPGSGAGGGA